MAENTWVSLCFCFTPKSRGVILRQTNIAMENRQFEDVCPIENGDIPASYVSLPEGISPYLTQPTAKL